MVKFPVVMSLAIIGSSVSCSSIDSYSSAQRSYPSPCFPKAGSYDQKGAIQIPYHLPVAKVEIAITYPKAPTPKPLEKNVKETKSGSYKKVVTVVKQKGGEKIEEVTTEEKLPEMISTVTERTEIQPNGAGNLSESQKVPTITVSVENVADTQASPLYMVYRPNYFTEDDVKVVTSNGLLKTSESHSIDKTPEVVQSVVELAIRASGSAPQLTQGEVQPTERELPKEGKFTFYLTCDNDRITANDILKQANVGVEIHINQSVKSGGKNVGIPDFLPTKLKGEGVYFRPLASMIVRDVCNHSIVYHHSMIPDYSTYFAVPFVRTFGGDFKTVMTINEGVLEGLSIKKKSEALNVVKIPLDAVKAILSAVPKGVLSYQEKQQSLEAETNFINAQLSLIEATQKLADAQNSDQSSSEDS